MFERLHPPITKEQLKLLFQRYGQACTLDGQKVRFLTFAGARDEKDGLYKGVLRFEDLPGNNDEEAFDAAELQPKAEEPKPAAPVPEPLDPPGFPLPEPRYIRRKAADAPSES